jgi:hypothetical protein
VQIQISSGRNPVAASQGAATGKFSQKTIPATIQTVSAQKKILPGYTKIEII